MVSCCRCSSTKSDTRRRGNHATGLLCVRVALLLPGGPSLTMMPAAQSCLIGRIATTPKSMEGECPVDTHCSAAASRKTDHALTANALPSAADHAGWIPWSAGTAIAGRRTGPSSITSAARATAWGGSTPPARTGSRRRAASKGAWRLVGSGLGSTLSAAAIAAYVSRAPHP